MIEIWKSIINYENLYEISNYGRVKRFYKDKRSKLFKILKPIKDKGREVVNLSKNGICKQIFIHKLVMEAFVGPCPKGMQICHGDGDPINNKQENLRYGTYKENANDKIKHGTLICGTKCWGAKLNDWKVRIIRRLAEDKYLTYKEIAEIFGVTKWTISAIINKRMWKHI